MPVLTDEERAEVGAIYVQQSNFLARGIGAAHVARNMARHLETALAGEIDGRLFQPLVYCWRGGQGGRRPWPRSSRSVGWRTTLLEGGYKTWRRHVTARLYDQTLPFRLVLLDGNTGSGKTEVLSALAALGQQAIEPGGAWQRIAGSLLGGFADRPQPGQKMFESRLLAVLDGLDPARGRCSSKAESSKVGERMVPPALWQAMAQAPRIELAASAEARAGYLVRAYRDTSSKTAPPRSTRRCAAARRPRQGAGGYEQPGGELADAGEFEALALGLMELHYDPAYRRSSRKETRGLLGEVDAGLCCRPPIWMRRRRRSSGGSAAERSRRGGGRRARINHPTKRAAGHAFVRAGPPEERKAHENLHRHHDADPARPQRSALARRHGPPPDPARRCSTTAASTR